MKRTQVFTLLIPAFCSILSLNNSAISQTTSATSGSLAIDAIASGHQSSASSSISTVPFSSSQSNELLLAFVSADSSSTASNSVTSVNGGELNWELVTRANNQLGDAEIWRAFTPSALSNVSVSAALSQSAAASITVIAFSGVDTTGTNGSGAVGASGSFSAASGPPAGSLVSTRNNSWVFAVGDDWDNALARTPGPNQNVVHQYLATVGDTYWVQQQSTITPASGTTVTMNDSAPANDRFNLALVEVLPAPITNPDFTLSATPSSQSVQAGSTTTFSESIVSQNGFSGAVDLSVSGLPTGVTASFSPASLSGSGASQLTITTSASTVPGSYPITITATGGTLSHTANITLVVSAAADFTLAVNPASQSVQPGSTTLFTVTITAQNGYSGSADLNVSGLPNGATATFIPTTVSGSGTSQLTVSAAASTATGSYPLTITAVSGSLTHTATASLVVSAPSTSAQLQIDRVSSGNRSTPQATISTGTFSTAQGGELLLAFISTDSSSNSSNAVTGVTGGGLTWQFVTRANKQPGDAEIWRALAPSLLSNVSVNAALSQSAAASITVVAFYGSDTTGTNGSGGVGASAAFSAASAAPTGSLVTTRDNSWVFAVGDDWDNATARTPGANQTMVNQYLATVGDTYWVQRQSAVTPTGGSTVTMNDTAPTGDRYNFAFVEVLPAQSTVGTNPDFTLTASPSAQSVQAGSTTTYPLNIAGQTGYSGTASLSITGLPNGATGTFNPTSVNGSGTSQLTVSTTGSTSPGSYTLTVTATSGTITHSVGVTLTVGAALDFTLAATPSSQSVQAGSSTTYSVNVAGQNGYSGTTNLNLSGLPSGAIGSFNPVSLNGTGASQLSISTTGSTGVGSYPLTITATSGNLTHTMSVTLAVVAVPDFTLSISPANLSVQAGQSVTYTATISGQNGYSATVNLSISGLPSGVAGTFNPASVSGSGSSQLVVATTASAAPGAYPITITVTAGSLTHTIGASLVITSSPQHSVSLSWADTDSGIAGYNMYRASQSGGPYAKLNTSLITSTSWTDNNVQSGLMYFYVVTAVNTSGAESSYSTQASALIPTP